MNIFSKVPHPYLGPTALQTFEGVSIWDSISCEFKYLVQDWKDIGASYGWYIAKIDGESWTFEGKRKAKLMFLRLLRFSNVFLMVAVLWN